MTTFAPSSLLAELVARFERTASTEKAALRWLETEANESARAAHERALNELTDAENELIAAMREHDAEAIEKGASLYVLTPANLDDLDPGVEPHWGLWRVPRHAVVRLAPA